MDKIVFMRTVDISIEDASFAELDAVSRAAGLTPAEFVRPATAAAVRMHKARVPPVGTPAVMQPIPCLRMSLPSTLPI